MKSQNNFKRFIFENFSQRFYFLNAVFILVPAASHVQFHGVAALHAFDAKVADVRGTVTVNSGALETAHGTLTMEVQSIDTGIGRRNIEMFKLLEPAKYPKIMFDLKSARPLPNVTEDGRVIEEIAAGETKCSLQGELVIRGIRRPIEGRGRCRDSGAGGWDIEGEAPVDMTAFGIVPPRLAFFTMDSVVKVSYELVFRP